MRRLLLITLTATLAACGTVREQPRTAQAQSRLDQELRGLTAGAPVACLPPGSSSHTTFIDDNTILFHVGPGRVYRNDPPGGCSPIGSGFYALRTSTSQSSLCRGDIAQVIDTSTGITVGSCGLGEFVPYRRAS